MLIGGNLVLVCGLIVLLKTQVTQASITFENGYPTQYISGSLHYFRVHPSDWRDRLQKLKWAGLDAVQTYVEWASHEPEPGTYDFSGILNLTEFLQIANEEGLSVILRPGPYICAERDMGGLPYWLLRLEPEIQFRTSDTRFMKYVRRWLEVLLPLIRPFAYGNGGPVAMVQVENEYGLSGDCDHVYLNELVIMMKKGLGNSTFLFSTDNGNVQSLQCSKIPPVYATVDFGPEADPIPEFEAERSCEKGGPLINSEFYTGWIDHWGEPHQTKTPQLVSSSFDNLLRMRASVNFYVFHGGTSFGFGAGSNQGPPFQSCPTSYDYDAPISEAGDLTSKYFDIRSVIKKYFPVPSGLPPPPTQKCQYGDISVVPISSVFNILPFLKYEESQDPQTFENLSVPNGLVVYQTILPATSSPSELDLYNTHDRGYVFINQTYIGVVSREEDRYSMTVSSLTQQVLTVAVESQGRISIGAINDFKGLLSTPLLSGKPLENWRMTPIPLYNYPSLAASIRSSEEAFHSGIRDARDEATNGRPRMRFYEGSFSIPEQTSQPQSTFLKLDMFTKGYAWINEFLLGRYWPIMGPQITLYVPHGALHQGHNSILILELETTSQDQNLFISLVDSPEIDGPTPGNAL